MENIKEYKCKNCGALLNLNSAANGVISCEYCNSSFTLPKKDADDKLLGYLAAAERNITLGKFDDAYELYRKASEYDSTEPEAYFGMAIANYKIQYLKDLVNNRLLPICYEFKKIKFTKDKNYQKALETATDEQRETYRQKGEEIEYIQREFTSLEASGLDYDCFICTKVTEESDTANGNRYTNDATEAHKIYNYIKKNGYKPFYSEQDIRGRTGAAYEALILYALYFSECMLIVCSDEKYLQSPWVKNEYTRFLKMLENEDKERDSIAFVFNGNPIENLPGKKGKIQGINLADSSALSDILKFVETHTPEATKKREEEKRKKEERQRKLEEQQARLDEVMKLLAEQNNPQSPVSRSVENSGALNFHDMVLAAQASTDTVEAQAMYNMILKKNKNYSDAWFGLYKLEYDEDPMSSLNEDICSNKDLHWYNRTLDDINAYATSFEQSENFQNAVNCAKGLEAVRLDSFKKDVISRANSFKNIIFDKMLEKTYAFINDRKFKDSQQFLSTMLREFEDDNEKISYCKAALFVIDIASASEDNVVNISKTKIEIGDDFDFVKINELDNGFIDNYKAAKTLAKKDYLYVLNKFEQNLCNLIKEDFLIGNCTNSIYSEIKEDNDKKLITVKPTLKKYSVAKKSTLIGSIAFGLLAIIFLVFWDISVVGAAVGFPALVIAIVLTCLYNYNVWDSLILKIFIGALYLLSVIFLIFWKLSPVGAGVGFPSLVIGIGGVVAFFILDRKETKFNIAHVNYPKKMNDFIEVCIEAVNDDFKAYDNLLKILESTFSIDNMNLAKVEITAEMIDAKKQEYGEDYKERVYAIIAGNLEQLSEEKESNNTTATKSSSVAYVDDKMYCEKCHSKVKPTRKFNVALFIILCFIYLIPGIIYGIVCLCRPKNRCPICKSLCIPVYSAKQKGLPNA